MAPTTPPICHARKRRVASSGSGTKTPTFGQEPSIPDTAPHGPPDGEQHDTNVRSDEVDTCPLEDNGILSLPCELLEIIASQLLGTTHIRNFGLVNKRVSGIVQQTIVRELIVSRKNIRGFLEMLGHHSELISKVSSVDLGDFGCSHRGGCLCVGTNSLDAGTLEALGFAIAATTGVVIDWTSIREANQPVDSAWKKESAFLLDVLALSCQNIKSVTVQLPEARPFDSYHAPRSIHRAPSVFPALNPELLPVAPFQGSALQVFQARLEALTIPDHTRWKGPRTMEVLESYDLRWRSMGSHIITLAGFSRLRRLDIPMDILGRPNDIFFSDTGILDALKNDVASTVDGAPAAGKTLAELRSKILPLSMQHLHLRSCNQRMFAVLQRINEAHVETMRLKHVELSFEPSPKNIILQCDAADLGRLDYLRLLTDFDRKAIKVTFHNGPQGVPVDMCKELEALSCLTPTEVWRCSVGDMPFSTWDPEASKRRHSLKMGFRYLLRHADHHWQLLNSPTFNLESWTQSAFFHGVANNKWDLQRKCSRTNEQPVESGEMNETTLGKRAFKRRLPPLLSLDTYEFGIHIQQKLAPLPQENEVFGANSTITSDMRAQSSDQRRDTAERPRAHKDRMKHLKQAKRIERKSHTTTEIHDLEDDVGRLWLGSANNVAIASQFSATAWFRVKWKTILQPKTVGLIAECLK